MVDTKEPPGLANTCSPAQNVFEKIAPSQELPSSAADKKLETDIVETPVSNGDDNDVYPSLVTKVFVGVGLALAVFLVFCP